MTEEIPLLKEALTKTSSPKETQPRAQEKKESPASEQNKKRKKRKKIFKYKKYMKSLTRPTLKKVKPFSLPDAVLFKKIDKI